MNKCVCNRCIYGTMPSSRCGSGEFSHTYTPTHIHTHQTGPNYSRSLFLLSKPRAVDVERRCNRNVVNTTQRASTVPIHVLSRKRNTHTHTHLKAGFIDGPSVNGKLGSISITRSSVAICRNAEKKEQSFPHPFVCLLAPFLPTPLDAHFPPSGRPFRANR